MILHVAQEEDEEELLAESEDTLTSEEAVAGKGIEGQWGISQQSYPLVN